MGKRKQFDGINYLLNNPFSLVRGYSIKTYVKLYAYFGKVCRVFTVLVK